MSPLWTAPVPAARRSGATAPSGAAHPARIGVAPPGFAMRAARHVEDDALVGEIDLDPVEQRQAVHAEQQRRALVEAERLERLRIGEGNGQVVDVDALDLDRLDRGAHRGHVLAGDRSEEHTSELQSLMRLSYAVFCLKKK